MKTLNTLMKLFKIAPKEESQAIFPMGLLVLAAIMLIGAIPIWWSPFKGFLAYGADEGIANYVIIRNMGLFFAGFLGIALAGWRAKSMDRQASVAEQGHITDRIIKATENLGSPEMAVRIGAIYTLWRTAVDSKKQSDKLNILDILCAYLCNPTIDAAEGKAKHDILIRKDVQAALSLVAIRRNDLNLEYPYQCNLAFANLHGANLINADLRGANLTGTYLTVANCSAAKLYGAQMFGVQISGAKFDFANLAHADLRGANLVNTHFIQSDLQNALFVDADINITKFHGSNLTGAVFNNGNTPYDLLSETQQKGIKVVDKDD